MMKQLLVFTFLFCAHMSDAATYYFSVKDGDDGRTAEQARRRETPWQTLEKLNAIFNTLAPGDSVLFKRGETFYGSIVANASGASNKYIVFSGWGTGSKPVISGFSSVSDWVSAGNNIYESAAAVSELSTLNLVTVDGLQYGMGRYPNSNAPNKGWLNTDEAPDAEHLTDAALSESAVNWAGARIMIRLTNWDVDTSTILSQSGTTLTFGKVYKTPKKGFGYFIMNDPRTLDRAGEWYYDPSTRKIKMYFSGAASSHTVKVATVNTLLSLENDSYLMFKDLRFEGANEEAWFTKRSSYISFCNCEIWFAGQRGLRNSGSGTNNITIDDAYITDCNNFGLDAREGGDSFKAINSVIRRCGIITEMGGGGSAHSRTGIIINSGSGHRIDNNQIDSVGYVGVRYVGNNILVQYNVIHDFCLVIDDGAGLHTGNTNKVALTNRVVRYNIIYNGMGASEGTAGNVRQAHGIYHDDASNGIETYITPPPMRCVRSSRR